MTPEIWIMLGTVGFAALSLAVLPWISRREFLFAVTVGQAFRGGPEGKRAIWRYESEVGFHTLVALVLTLIGATRGGVGLMIGGILWLVFGGTVALVRGHRAVMPFRIAVGGMRRADLAPRGKSSAAVIVASLLPLLFFVELAFYAHLQWEQLPDRIAVHWGLNGADRWLAKSPRAVYGLISLMAVTSLSLGIAAWGILRGTRRIALNASGAGHESRFKRVCSLLLLVTAYAMVVPAWLALRPVDGDSGSAVVMNIWGAATMVISIGVVCWMIYAGQGGSRAAREAGTQELDEQPIGDRTPDECWKWGLFYFNPDDSAIFVEKRFGVGYTINMGNVWGWVVMALMLAPLGFIWVLR